MLQRFFRPRRNVLSEMKAVSQILQDELVHEDDYEWALCELCGGALLCLDDSADPARGVWATRLPCACRPPPRPAPPAQRGGGGSGLRRGCPATCRGPANIAHDASRVLQEMCFAGALAASEGGAGRRFGGRPAAAERARPGAWAELRGRARGQDELELARRPEQDELLVELFDWNQLINHELLGSAVCSRGRSGAARPDLSPPPRDVARHTSLSRRTLTLPGVAVAVAATLSAATEADTDGAADAARQTLTLSDLLAPTEADTVGVRAVADAATLPAPTG